MTINHCSSEARRTRRTLASGLAMMFVLLLFGVLLATPAHAKTFTVNSTDDDPAAGPTDDGECTTAAAGECTLRAAIKEANNTPGADTIAFNIPTTGVATIEVGKIPPGSTTGNGALPSISKPVTIDGYTQGDATPDPADDATENTLTQPGKTNAVLKIVLDGGTSAGQAGSGLSILDADDCTIKGLVINRFSAGVHISTFNQPDSSATGNKVEGNFIGADASGGAITGLGNREVGVAINDKATKNTIGGTTAGARNMISDNDQHGVFIGSAGPSGNRVQGNLIGINRNGDPLPNGGDGVRLYGSGPGNRILSNSINNNDGLGINLISTNPADGVTANDGDDPNTSKPDPDKDTGSNNLQNYPLLTSAQVFEELFGDTTTITGELTSTPSTRKKKRTFTIQFFSSPEADPSGFGEGKIFLGQIKVRTDRNGVARDANGNPGFNFTVNQDLTGQYVTATATNNRTGDTSEFSQAREVEEPVIGL